MRRITVVRGDDGYPARLADLRDPPSRLRVWGTLPPSSAPSAAIVGTRYASAEGEAFARDVAAEAVRRGHVVVSGGARGIDRAAHEGALDAGGITVVVAPAGLDHPYPPEHLPLYERVVAAGGAVVSEYGDVTPIARGRFLARNRIVAAWGTVTVVVEAPARSGALSTAREARALGRPVFAVPHAPWDSRGEGGLALLRRGASLCTSPASVFGGPEPRRTRSAVAATEGAPLTERILAALGGRPRHVDDLVRALHVPAPEVLAALLSLRLAGRVEERGGGRFAQTRER